MKISSFYGYHISNGQSEFPESATQPDLATDIRDLYENYSVGQMPSLAVLQPLFDDDNFPEPDDDYMNDVRGLDRAGRSLAALNNSRLRDSIIDRLRTQFAWRKEREERELGPVAKPQEPIIDAPVEDNK